MELSSIDILQMTAICFFITMVVMHCTGNTTAMSQMHLGKKMKNLNMKTFEGLSGTTQSLSLNVETTYHTQLHI